MISSDLPIWHNYPYVYYMARSFYRRWLLMALKGILAIIFGIITLFYPEITISILASIFGVFAISGGIIVIISALRNRKFNQFWTHWFLEGIVDIIIGLIVVLNPQISVAVFLGLIALWAILNGIILLFSYFRFKKLITRRRVILFSSIISIFFGLTVLFNPMVSTFVLSYLIGSYILIYGIFSVLTAIKLTQA